MKKITLAFTILCASALNSMEPASLSELGRPGKETTYEDTYASLPQELKQEIINTALATSNNLPDAIKAIKAFSALHGVDYNQLKNDTLVNTLMKKFPTTVKDVIIFALKKPELYQEINTILEKNGISKGIEILYEKEILQKKLKEFTLLMHIIDEQEKSNLKKENKKPINTIADFATKFPTPLAKKYLDLGYKLFMSNSSEKTAELLNQGADINYSNKFSDVPHTPLSFAAITGDVDLVKFLLNAGANPYFEIPETGTALNIVLEAIEEQKKPEYFNLRDSKQLETIKSLLEQAMQNYPTNK